MFFLAELGLHCTPAFYSEQQTTLFCSLQVWLLLLQNTGSRQTGFSIFGSWALGAGSVVVAHKISCSAARGIFPDHALNLILCIGRWILNNWNTRDVQNLGIFMDHDIMNFNNRVVCLPEATVSRIKKVRGLLPHPSAFISYN